MGVTRRQTLPTTHHKSVSVHECWVILLVAIPSFIMGYNPNKVKAKQTVSVHLHTHTHTHTDTPNLDGNAVWMLVGAALLPCVCVCACMCLCVCACLPVLDCTTMRKAGQTLRCVPAAIAVVVTLPAPRPAPPSACCFYSCCY